MTPQQRFELIVSRQGRFRWGEIYTPSTLAVTREAPKGSRISRLNSRKLGRTLHVLSTPERVFAQLALYHPELIDIHEQKMLSPVTTIHPLHGHPLTVGTFPPPLRGTLEIATQIGFKHHEIVVTNSSGERKKVPFPYQGDLLLFMASHTGIPYAVNWSVKDVRNAFSERRLSSAKSPIQQKKDRDHAQLRAKLELEYYASAGIRTVQVSLDMIDPVVIANLDLLFSMHELSVTHDSTVMSDFSRSLQEAFANGIPLAHVALQYGARWGCRDQFIAAIYQDIWSRKLSINFFEPILIDHPLKPSEQDLLSVYGSLFVEFEA
ncbi:hypothetical protein ACTO5A_35640 [Pseudomonas aeruginosa]